jgi:superfamily II DNA or RNA helicase
LQLRKYQVDFERNIYNAWNAGARNVLGVLPTGSGKTVAFAKVLADHNGSAIAIAHRQELVAQISVALAQRGVEHQIIGPLNVVKFAVSRQIEVIGSSFYKPNARVTVAGVDTLTRRREALSDWAKSVTLWVQDEAHHVLVKNKWGKAAELFPNAYGLGVTATPVRADGYGLGRHADGLFDTMVEGPGMRYLIDDGFLTDYRIFAPGSDLDLDSVNITNTGDYSKPQLKKAVQKSRIMGDVVEHYKRIAPGKLGVTFTVDVETATETAERFRAAGVPAEVVSHKTPDRTRAAILRRFRQRQILQLVNVDLFGEGFDLPAIEVCSFARPTESYALYCQQFGRALRLMLGDVDETTLTTPQARRAAIASSCKPTALIIDHVGNVVRHNLPDAHRVWSLDRRDKRGRLKDDGLIPVTSCPECTGVYERTHHACPYCGYVPIPANRSKPEYVNGDLCELDPTVLAAMRGDVERIDMNLEDYRSWLAGRNVPLKEQMVNVKRLAAKQEVQVNLRSVMAWWAGWQHAQGRTDDRENQRRFFHTFNTDVLTAQTLGPRDAIALGERIVKEMCSNGCQNKRIS